MSSFAKANRRDTIAEIQKRTLRRVVATLADRPEQQFDSAPIARRGADDRPEPELDALVANISDTVSGRAAKKVIEALRARLEAAEAELERVTRISDGHMADYLHWRKRAEAAVAEAAALREDELARSLYDRTAAIKGFINAPQWMELAEATRELYREKIAARKGQEHGQG